MDPQLLKLERFVDLRYQRQTSELTLAVPDQLPFSSFAATMTKLFHEEHERTYGYRRYDEPITVVNLRLKAFASTKSVTFAELAESFHQSITVSSTDETRPAYFGPTFGERQTRILSRAALLGRSLEGPLVLEEFDTTVVVPPGWVASLDHLGNVILVATG